MSVIRMNGVTKRYGQVTAVDGVSVEELADAAQLASLADETPEGRSIVVLAKKHGLRERNIHEMGANPPVFTPFSAQTRMSGVTLQGPEGWEIRKGAADAIRAFAAAEEALHER